MSTVVHLQGTCTPKHMPMPMPGVHKPFEFARSARRTASPLHRFTAARLRGRSRAALCAK